MPDDEWPMAGRLMIPGHLSSGISDPASVIGHRSTSYAVGILLM
jgi:hypothetical protein